MRINQLRSTLKAGEAARIWHELIAKAPADAPWLTVVRQSVARVEGTAVPGPRPEDVAAASEMAPEQRNQMIRTMVDRLAVRLHELRGPDRKLPRGKFIYRRTRSADRALPAVGRVGDRPGVLRVDRKDPGALRRRTVLPACQLVHRGSGLEKTCRVMDLLTFTPFTE